MQRFHRFALAALAALGLAFTGPAIAQKAETPKDATAKKADAKATDAKKADTKATESKKADAKADAKKADAKPATGLIDINTASEKELASLKGIGDVRAKAIVKNRPYKGKNDLVDRKIIPQNVYDDVKEQIIAKQDTAAAPKKDEKKK